MNDRRGRGGGGGGGGWSNGVCGSCSWGVSAATGDRNSIRGDNSGDGSSNDI
jgi:hypothetical protein